MKQLLAIILISLLCINVVSVVEAEIYKCTNKQGKVFFKDKPCLVDESEKKLRHIKDPKYLAPLFNAASSRKGLSNKNDVAPLSLDSVNKSTVKEASFSKKSSSSGGKRAKDGNRSDAMTSSSRSKGFNKSRKNGVKSAYPSKVLSLKQKKLLLKIPDIRHR